MKPWVKWVALVVLVAFLASFGTGFFAIGRMLAHFATTVPPAARPNATPALLGLPYEEWSAVSEDGVHLKAWWVPSPGQPRLAPVIVIHGLGAGKEFMLGYASYLHAQGRGALLIDLRGHGGSDPSLTTLGAREPLDIAAWVALLHDRGLPPPILWGTSLGAVAALRAAEAAAPGTLAGVIADAPFDTLRHTLAVHARLFFNLPEFPLVPLTAWQIGRRLDIRVDDIDSGKAVRSLHLPLLLIAAEHDRRMAPDSIRRLFAEANEPKRFYLIPGEDHESRHFGPGFQKALTDFLALCDQKSGN